jgi:hypothetical protein
MICIKKKNETLVKMVLECLALVSVRKADRWKPRVELESRENKRAVANFKSFNKDRRLKWIALYALHGFSNAYYITCVCLCGITRVDNYAI